MNTGRIVNCWADKKKEWKNLQISLFTQYYQFEMIFLKLYFDAI